MKDIKRLFIDIETSKAPDAELFEPEYKEPKRNKDGIHIGLSIGGCADDVYRLSVNTDPISIKQLHTENEITFIYAK